MKKPLANLILVVIASLLAVSFLPRDNVGGRRLATPSNTLGVNGEEIGSPEGKIPHRSVFYGTQRQVQAQNTQEVKEQPPSKQEQQQVETVTYNSEPQGVSSEGKQTPSQVHQKQNFEETNNRPPAFQAQVHQAHMQSRQEEQQVPDATYSGQTQLRRPQIQHEKALPQQGVPVQAEQGVTPQQAGMQQPQVEHVQTHSQKRDERIPAATLNTQTQIQQPQQENKQPIILQQAHLESNEKSQPVQVEQPRVEQVLSYPQQQEETVVSTSSSNTQGQEVQQQEKEPLQQQEGLIQAEANPLANVNDAQKQQVQEVSSPGRRRPVIYTFWTLNRSKNGKLDYGQKSKYEELLMAWQELWIMAGWEPRILTMEDAKKHPLFPMLHDLLISHADNMNVHEEGYDYLCFMRWLAMATKGTGGWMSDYDTIPMGITTEIGLNMPNNGRFTSYEGHIPSLVSGNAREWNRMAAAMVLQFEEHVKEDPTGFYSDMFALRDLAKRSFDERGAVISNYIQEGKVSKYPYSPTGRIVCAALRKTYAAHLAHHYTHRAIQSGKITVPEGKSEKDRHYFARVLTKKWLEECNPDLQKIRGGV